MPEEIKVVGLGGSLAASSSSLAALKIAIEGAAEGGARTELFDLRDLELPMYAPRGAGLGPAVVRSGL